MIRRLPIASRGEAERRISGRLCIVPNKKTKYGVNCCILEILEKNFTTRICFLFTLSQERETVRLRYTLKQTYYLKLLYGFRFNRKDTKTVFLRNSTLLPVQWRLNGLENLGDDFSVATDHGVIEPRSEYGLQVHFRAARPVTIKKIVRLEVCIK